MKLLITTLALSIASLAYAGGACCAQQGDKAPEKKTCAPCKCEKCKDGKECKECAAKKHGDDKK